MRAQSSVHRQIAGACAGRKVSRVAQGRPGGGVAAALSCPPFLGRLVLSAYPAIWEYFVLTVTSSGSDLVGLNIRRLGRLNV
jgi:hypothetical protein